MCVNNSKIGGGLHSLFIKTTEVKTVTRKFKLYISIFENTNKEEKHNQLVEVIEELDHTNVTDNDSLDIHITSPGGYINEYKNIHNLIVNKFKDITTTYIDAEAASAGAYLFLSANKRVIYLNSVIMLHYFSSGYHGTHRKIKDEFNFESKTLKEVLLKPIKKYVSKKQYEKVKSGRDVWLDYKDMLLNGMATHIIIDDVLLTSKQAIKKLKLK